MAQKGPPRRFIISNDDLRLFQFTFRIDIKKKDATIFNIDETLVMLQSFFDIFSFLKPLQKVNTILISLTSLIGFTVGMLTIDFSGWVSMSKHNVVRSFDIIGIPTYCTIFAMKINKLHILKESKGISIQRLGFV